MKRIILSLALGVLLINLTGGCSKSDTTAPDATAPAPTNSAATNAPTH